MSLDWDLTEVENNKDVCWTPSLEEGKVILNPVTNAIIWSTMLVGFSKITTKNYKDFHRRLIEFEVISGSGMLDAVPKENEQRSTRQPNLQEVEDHIGLSTNVRLLTEKEWTTYLRRLVKDETTRRIKAVN